MVFLWFSSQKFTVELRSFGIWICSLAAKIAVKSIHKSHMKSLTWKPWVISHVPIFHITQPLGIWSINVYNGYYKVMSIIPKNGTFTNPWKTSQHTWHEDGNILWLVVERWFFALPLWKMMDLVKVSWDDEIPNCFWKVIQNSMVPVTTNQFLSWRNSAATLRYSSVGRNFSVRTNSTRFFFKLGNSSNYQWIGLRENLNRKPMGFTIKLIGLSCKFSHHPILWNSLFMVDVPAKSQTEDSLK